MNHTPRQDQMVLNYGTNYQVDNTEKKKKLLRDLAHDWAVCESVWIPFIWIKKVIIQFYE